MRRSMLRRRVLEDDPAAPSAPLAMLRYNCRPPPGAVTACTRDAREPDVIGSALSPRPEQLHAEARKRRPASREWNGTGRDGAP